MKVPHCLRPRAAACLGAIKHMITSLPNHLIQIHPPKEGDLNAYELRTKNRHCATMPIILVTGGSGYIGSHTCIALDKAGYTPLILDNFSNSNASVLDRMEVLMNHRPLFIKGDVRDEALLKKIFQEHDCTGVIHFAGLKAVGESIAQPLEYYDVNVTGSLSLLMAMQYSGVKRLIFSSSAAVYVKPESLPIKESATRSTVNPYGRSKLMVEDILEDFYYADPSWSIARLRYFNPIGAHPSGLIGEAPQGVPNNLMPYITQVAVGLREKLSVFGGDYPTHDGSAVRDYVHVMDLAEGHVAALNWCQKGSQQSGGMLTVNLGTGTGSSVLEIVRAFEMASGKKIPYEIVARRAGDIAECWADSTDAAEILHWKATRSLEEMCRDSWHWEQQKRKEEIATKEHKETQKRNLAMNLID